MVCSTTLGLPPCRASVRLLVDRLTYYDERFSHLKESNTNNHILNYGHIFKRQWWIIESMLYDQMIRSLGVRGHLVVPSFESRLHVLPHTQNSFSNIFSFSDLLLFFIPNIPILPITPPFFSFFLLLGKNVFPLPLYFSSLLYFAPPPFLTNIS